jgi:hypothetical protein
MLVSEAISRAIFSQGHTTGHPQNMDTWFTGWRTKLGEKVRKENKRIFHPKGRLEEQD